MHLYVAVFGDEFEAVEIRAHLRDVVDYGCDAKDGWMSAIVLHINKSQFQQIQIQNTNDKSQLEPMKLSLLQDSFSI